jgi:multidrug transporter EmrE-like cation transporter
MNAFVYSIILVIAAQSLYQLAMKAVPAGANPLNVLIVAYGLAIAVCLVLSPLVGSSVTPTALRRLLTWPTVLLALSVVGIEVGYILAYRAGWKIGMTYAFASGATVAILALFGTLYFGEQLDIKKVLGIILVLAGGWLVVG